jgi:nucleoside-triphosphatase THEP1
MKIAYVVNRGATGTDPVITETAERLISMGHCVAGLVQSNTERGDGCRCDMDVKVLPSGEVFRISQDRGPAARGCRLDPSMLEAGVALVDRALDGAPDILVLNKFGKHEAEGRGFRQTIAEALARGIPVILGINPLNLEAFLCFAGEMAEEIACTPQATLGWAQAALDSAPSTLAASDVQPASAPH